MIHWSSEDRAVPLFLFILETIEQEKFQLLTHSGGAIIVVKRQRSVTDILEPGVLVLWLWNVSQSLYAVLEIKCSIYNAD